MTEKPIDLLHMQPCLRSFGPHDPVSLQDIRQCGCREVFTALHEVSPGEVWSSAAIRERKQLIQRHGLEWTVVESLPVSESIKCGDKDAGDHIEKYSRSLENLAGEGINCVIYNFMPVLDWVRTDLAIALPDGSRTVGFDPVRWAAFNLFILKLPGISEEFSAATRQRAESLFSSLNADGIDELETSITSIFPGSRGRISLDKIRGMVAKYDGIDRGRLQEHLSRFLEAVLPVAEANGIRLAIHPDDPPFPVLGLPRIVSDEADLQTILSISESPAHGICLCPGSLAVRPDNDVNAVTERFADRIHAVHLRNIARDDNGAFRESPHLEGVVDMPAVVVRLLQEQKRRRDNGLEHWRLPMRPDHGLTILDDLEKPPPVTPGYTCLGRMKGLAELRGLQDGLLFEE